MKDKENRQKKLKQPQQSPQTQKGQQTEQSQQSQQTKQDQQAKQGQQTKNSPQKQKGQQTQVLKKVLSCLGRYRIFLVLSLVLAAISVALTLYVPKLTGYAVDEMLGAGAVDFAAIFRIMLKIGICTAVTALAQWLMSLCNNKMTYQVVRDIRSRAFARLSRLPLSYTDSRTSGEIVSRMIADVDQFSDGLLMGFTQLFTGAATIVGTLCFMLSVNVRITIVVVVITPVSFLVAGFIAKQTFHLFKKQSEIRGELTGQIDERIQNQKVVQAFGRRREVVEEFDAVNEELEDAYLKATFFSSITNPSTRFVNSLVYTGVGITGAFLAIRGALTVGQLSSFLSYANQYTKPFNEISGVMTEFQNAIACAGRVFELIEEEPEPAEPAEAVDLAKVYPAGADAKSCEENTAELTPAAEARAKNAAEPAAAAEASAKNAAEPAAAAEASAKNTAKPAAACKTAAGKTTAAGPAQNAAHGITRKTAVGETAVGETTAGALRSRSVRCEGVYFSYNPAQHLIEDFHLEVKPGQRIAIVGPTGCGKTTLINLLMRFYDVDAGSISVDGYDIREVTRESLRAAYGMVLQDTWLRTGTIRENICLARPDASDAEMIAAAKAAHIHSFISRLLNGYDTQITGEGEGLSQGQKQLLCIARVMLCRPPMLILDEATSSIDTRTEMQVQQAFAELMEGRTTFIVAHRLSTIRSADRILVMKDGTVIEQGRHEELLEQGGFYRTLYESQWAAV